MPTVFRQILLTKIVEKKLVCKIENCYEILAVFHLNFNLINNYSWLINRLKNDDREQKQYLLDRYLFQIYYVYIKLLYMLC